MAILKLNLDQETLDALMDLASRERRPADWQAEVLLRQALGLPFPYPPEKATAGRWRRKAAEDSPRAQTVGA